MKITHSIRFRFFLIFGIVLSLFGILIGSIYIYIYEQTTIKANQEHLLSQGKRITRDLKEYISNDDEDGYNYYMTALDQVLKGDADIWILSNNKANEPMSDKYANVKLSSISSKLDNDTKDILESAYNNKQKHYIAYDKIFETTMIKFAFPITIKKDVVGVVLLNSFIEQEYETIKNNRNMILYSIFIAQFISLFISIILVRQITKPLMKIKTIALSLSEGNYNIKTEIQQKDEVGELALCIDILSEKLAESEEERKRMEQMKTDFFANISHELRTPITVMRGYTESLYDGVVTKPEKINKYYEKMISECQSMERLVEDLLILSKLQNQEFTVVKEAINPDQLFSDIISSAKVMAGKEGIIVNVTNENNVDMIMGDYNRLKQMFMVVIHNAVKFSQKGSNIYIDIKGEENLTIKIRDEGIGISEDDFPSIFEKFYTSKLRQNASGSGLGLVIAKQIALRHNVEIKVESKVGEGTGFTFIFQNRTKE